MKPDRSSNTSPMRLPRRLRAAVASLVAMLTVAGLVAAPVPAALGADLADFAEPFHFLEPLAPREGDAANFDASLLDDLVVEICRLEGSSCTLMKTFTSQGSSSERLRIASSPLDGSYYLANWDTAKTRLAPHTYRVGVVVAELELGSIDVGPAAYGSFGRTWPVKFLIENNPTIRVRILRSRDESASQVANAIRTEFDLGPDDVAALLAADLEPFSDEEIELALKGVFQPAVVPETTKIADDATQDALASFDPDTGTLAFSTSTPTLAALDVGDVLVSEPSAAAPNGYLRKIESITRQKKGGGVVLATTQATINDVVSEGTLDAAGELQADDLLATEAMVPGVTFSERQPAIAGLGALDVGDGFNFHTNIDVTLDGAASGDGVSGTGTVRIQGEIRFNAGYNVGFGVEACVAVPPVCVDRFEAHLGLDQYSRIQVDGEFDGHFQKELVLSTHYFKPIVFFIGPIPVVLVPIVKAMVGARGDAHLEFSFAAEVQSRVELGAKWTDPDEGGVGWENASAIEPLEHADASGDLDANMELRAYGKADAKLLLYGIAGPGFAGRVGVGADVKFPRSPLWYVFGHAQGEVNFAVDLGGVLKLAEYSEALPEVRLDLLQAANQPPACGARQDPIPVAVDEEVYLGPRFGGIFDGYFDCADPEGGEIVDYDGSVGGVPLDLAKARWMTEGTRIVDVTATDEDGKTTTFSITVNVINTPPILSLATAAGTVPATVQYFVTASAYDVETDDFIPCTSIDWSAPGGTLTETLDNRTCTAIVTFDTTGPHSVTAVATDAGGKTSEETVTVNVTAAPANPAPVIDADSFRVVADEGPKTTCALGQVDCEPRYSCPSGFFCGVPFGAVLHNGQVGDFHPPLTFWLEASDPNGDALQVTWFCSAGATQYPVADNGDGTFSCSPYSASTSIPIVVRAEASDGVTIVRSEIRELIMLDRVG